VLVSIFVTLPSRIYKGGQGPPSKQKISRSFYIKGIQTTIQDVGYYAPCGPNLSKSCVPCTFEFLISASPHPKLTTLGISFGGQPVKHRQRHAPSTPRNLQRTLDNYLILSSIGFNKASLSTLMLGTQEVDQII
jgi:hypothetical protein